MLPVNSPNILSPKKTPISLHNVPTFSPLVLVKNPKENIQLPDKLEKVFIDNPDAYDPLEGRENHELEQLNNVKIPDRGLKEKFGYVFKSKLKPGDLGIECPIEDPRNPYHHEYLKLKVKRDGHLKEEKPNIFENGRKKIWEDHEMKDDEVGSNTPFNSKNNNKKLKRVRNDLEYPPLPEVNEIPKNDKEVDKFHYCEDCDLAFKKPELRFSGGLPQARIVHSQPIFDGGVVVVGGPIKASSSPGRMLNGGRR